MRAVRSVVEQARPDRASEEIRFDYRADHTWVPYQQPVRFASQSEREDEESPPTPPVGAGSVEVEIGQHFVNGSHKSPSQQNYLTYFEHGNTILDSNTTPVGNTALYQAARLWPFQDGEEAKLLRYFIDTIGPQLDATDRCDHFTRVVPSLAAHSPLLMYAILAIASIHRNRLTGAFDALSEEYQARCLRSMIDFLEDPDYRPNESFLAAIVLLRKFEEMSDEDQKCHLLGSARIINSLGAVAADGGLGEAAAWLALRQSVYICLISNSPLDLNIDCYRASAAFLEDTDYAWANRSVALCAEALNAASSNAESTEDKGNAWTSIRANVSAWFDGKPDTFHPMFEAYHSASATNEDFWFPEIRMLLAPHVIGMIYYYLTQIVLDVNAPRFEQVSSNTEAVELAFASTPFSSLHAWNRLEARVRQYIRICVGLAQSNQHVIAAHFEASHILYACGHCLNSPGERREAIKFLQGVPAKLGWETEHIVTRLEQYWNVA